MLNKHNHNGETKLHIASRRGDLDRVSQLLKLGAFVDVICNAGYSPLHEACCHRHYSVAQMLCKYGADANLRGPGGMRPIHEAADVKDAKIVTLLIKNGADAALFNDDGKTASDLAEGDPDIIEALKSTRKARVAAVHASLLNALSA